jgi:hypothetical protein
MQCWNENHDRERYILDSLRVPVILDPALLDLIDDSPSTSRFTLQSKIDILLLLAVRVYSLVIINLLGSEVRR